MGKQISFVPMPEDEIWSIVNSESFQQDGLKMRGGNNAAGVRLRKQLFRIEKLAKQARKECIEIRNNSKKNK